jgi:NAD(P)-dependent dehydrogenase (short-subunit alcohol dehydrogenase family)
MPDATILITGANRGLGLAMAQRFARKGLTVIGTARNPDDADELRSVATRVERLDQDDPESVARFAAAMSGQPIDVLFNNAGQAPQRGGLAEVDLEDLVRHLSVNAVGPMRVTKALLDNLRAGRCKLVVNMSSELGSITNNTGDMYAYRAGKAALNMLTVTAAREFEGEGMAFLAMHPGWVRTRMGGEQAPLTPDASAAGMVDVVLDAMQQPASFNGAFVNYSGERLPW